MRAGFPSSESPAFLWASPHCLLHNASLTSRPASPLSSPTDYARCSVTAASTTDFDSFSSCATGQIVLPAVKREKARCGENRLRNASLTSRPASPLSSPTDYARRSITAASTTDFDGFSSCATGPTVLPAVKREKARCGENRLRNASLTSRPASPLSSPISYFVLLQRKTIVRTATTT
jgi:hypothetical protein